MSASDFVFVYDDFVPQWLYDRAIREICCDQFPWFYPAVGVQGETDPYRSCFGINLIKSTGEDATHFAPSINFIWEFFKGTYADVWPEPEIIRLRGNMYAPGQYTSRHHDNVGKDAWALLYYLTDSDGGTEIEGTEYEHRANRAVIFPADMMHQARPCTSPARVTLNWNFTSGFDYAAHRENLADK